MPHNAAVIPHTRYARVGSWRLAYQVAGHGPPDFVLSAGSYNHTEAQWEDPGAAVFFDRIIGFSRLIRFDPLGVGGSDRVSIGEQEPSFSDQLVAVLDEIGSGRVALMAGLDAGFGAIEFAVDHPERLTHLILYNSSARYTRTEGYDAGVDEEALAMIAPLLEDGWGTDAMTRLSVPSRADDPRFAVWYSKYMRAVGTPTEVSRRFSRSLELDVRHLLPRVVAPTLVLHRHDYAIVPRAQGEYLADHIVGAQYFDLPGSDGPLYWQEPDLTLRFIERFVGGRDPGVPASRPVLTLLFTDIASSTKRITELGDRDWLAVLRQHDEIASRISAAHHGRIVKTTGDGILAVFPNPSSALNAVRAIRSELEKMRVDIRAGVHVGEVEETAEGEVLGLAVHIAARVMDRAGTGEIVVSRTVRDLLAGSVVAFEEAGSHDLKGLPESWELYRLVE